jgi:hypothetical protein
LQNFLFNLVQALICSFFYEIQQDIPEASNERVRTYINEIVEANRFDAKITAIMRAVAKAKAALYLEKFSKYTSVANPKLGNKSLEEV